MNHVIKPFTHLSKRQQASLETGISTLKECYYCEDCKVIFESKQKAIDHHNAKYKHSCSDIIRWDDNDGWIIWLKDFGIQLVGIAFCPFCGKSLPSAEEVKKCCD